MLHDGIYAQFWQKMLSISSFCRVSIFGYPKTIYHAYCSPFAFIVYRGGLTKPSYLLSGRTFSQSFLTCGMEMPISPHTVAIAKHSDIDIDFELLLLLWFLLPLSGFEFCEVGKWSDIIFQIGFWCAVFNTYSSVVILHCCPNTQIRKK